MRWNTYAFEKQLVPTLPVRYINYYVKIEIEEPEMISIGDISKDAVEKP